VSREHEVHHFEFVQAQRLQAPKGFQGDYRVILVVEKYLTVMELTPINGFFLVIALIATVLWFLGLCAPISAAMHAQAMEYNDVYTGLTEEEEEGEKARIAQAKLQSFLKGQPKKTR